MELKVDDGYRGIWYMNQPEKTMYKYKYSGGLGTYCAKHIPLAVYSSDQNKTFFCYGGTNESGSTLLHMVSCFDHDSGLVPKPRILLDKKTTDAHDNPVLALDGEGYIWIFSTSHGMSRPSYIHRSTEPGSINAFDKILQTNFSYAQPWFMNGLGFLFLHTSYFNGRRYLSWMTSPDGKEWSEREWLAGIEKGHYQVSWHYQSNRGVAKVGTAFNYHPEIGGLNFRTNLYYVETRDFGESWVTVEGDAVDVPMMEINNPALVRDYASENKLVYMKDMCFDHRGNPVLLYMTSRGYQPGPANDPRTWTLARWNGKDWKFNYITTSDNNYDTGCLHVPTKGDGEWNIVAPTTPGPQPGNPGGEMVSWSSTDGGSTWNVARQLTRNSKYNHTYARKPVNANPGFIAFWADGDCRKPSKSNLHFYNREKDIPFTLPRQMTTTWQTPVPSILRE
ncbi:MAG: BNR-4 repeat-containing protein [Promethearchaeota archaeon]